MREQRLVFGEVAELYDKARPGYPDVLVDDVVDFARVGTGARVLEVGAGTGKATVAFAARGLSILALEPSAEMAAVARRNCQSFPDVHIESTTLEAWPVAAQAFDLVISAQAWHWVDIDVRYRKAAEALKPDGALSLFWHRTQWNGEPLFYELDDLYRRLAPDVYARHPTFPFRPAAGSEQWADEIDQTGLFQPATARIYPWPATFTADTFVDLLLTQSDHRLMDDDTQARLLEAIRAVIAAHGGTVTVPHATLLIMAHRAGQGA